MRKFSINSIRMYNYRQYRGENFINFESNPDKNVSILMGRNGAGKSNILNALTWCFYGSEIHNEGKFHSEDEMPVINAEELQSLYPNDTAHAEVEITLNVDNEIWTIWRKIGATKDKYGKVHVDPKSEIKVSFPRAGETKFAKDEQSTVLINTLLPEDIKKFFFMDGEQLHGFFVDNAPEKIAGAIDIVSQLDIIYNTAEHLEWLRADLKREHRGTKPKLDEYVEKIDKLGDAIRNLNNRKQSIESNIKKDENDLEYVKNYLKGQEGVSDLEKKRETYENDLEKYRNWLDKAENDRNSYLVGIAPYIYLINEINMSKDLIKNSINSGDLPPKIKKDFVEDLLHRKICICGNELSEENIKTLKDYASQLRMTDLDETIFEGKQRLEDIIQKIKEFPTKIFEYNNSIKSYMDEIEDKNGELKAISKKIADSNIDEIVMYENRRDQLNRLIGENQQQIKAILKEIEEKEESLKKEEASYSKELDKDEKFNDLKNRLDLVEKSLGILSEIEVSVKEKIRSNVEVNTCDIFNELIRKDDAFENIEIDAGFNISIKRKGGYFSALNNLSAGEYLILALSFMAALMNISGFHAPVIIDTPFGKIDDVHREAISRNLPEFLRGTQLVFLVTPTEYDETIKRNLTPYTQNYFEIKDNESGTASEVISYGSKTL